MAITSKAGITRQEAFEFGCGIRNVQDLSEDFDIDKILRLEHLQSKLVGKPLHPQIFFAMIQGYKQLGLGNVSSRDLDGAISDFIEGMEGTVEMANEGYLIKDEIIEFTHDEGGISKDVIMKLFEADSEEVTDELVDESVAKMLRLGIMYAKPNDRFDFTELGVMVADLNDVKLAAGLNAETLPEAKLRDIDHLFDKKLIAVGRDGAVIPTENAFRLRRQVIDLNEQRRQAGLPIFDVDAVVTGNEKGRYQ